MPEDKTVLLLQGSGINEGHGVEDLVKAMQQLPNCHLFIVGNGTIVPLLKQMTETLNLQERITFVPRQTPENLFNYTALADIGICPGKDVGPNARFSLPNKIFEYIKAGTPMVVADLPEWARVMRQYEVGAIAPGFTPDSITAAVEELSDPGKLARCRENCRTAAKELTWENEEKTLEQVYARFFET
jgi:glycosyltransferase involved in cell wall biosynthesis